MTFRRRGRRYRGKNREAVFPQQDNRAGLLVTSELEKALAECKARVERISADCRRQNRRFRDVEFDLENDRERCLFGLSKENSTLDPSDVQRVNQIFSKPSFFIDGADSNDLIQGRLGDCWFLSALSTMTTAPGLIEKFCVARDEKVGVFGWIFFRDTTWVTVIIDDLLFTTIPKFEELTQQEQTLYHRDKTLYNTSARKGGKSLYFARSGTEGETWVPLIEKAYAKLHGDYASLKGGYSCEAIEDMTGGVTTFIPIKDILDPELFWKEELLLATTDRLFGCSFDSLDSSRNGKEDATVNGLIGGHAYSVLRAVEFRGKRFVVLRNPWGNSEWTGPWSDGSKEWSEEWLGALKELKHTFGDDGEFVMEYGDFLDNWDLVERTLLFDDTWVMSSQWLQVTARPPSTAWSYGDVSFTVAVPAPTKAIFVLSKLDERYFIDISGNSCWTFEFALFKKGSAELVAHSTLTRFYLRSVNLEAQLEKGDYVVHVRLDREVVNANPKQYNEANCDNRKLARVQTERAKSQSIASNFKPSVVLENLPIPLNILAGQDLTELEVKALLAEKQLHAAEAGVEPQDPTILAPVQPNTQANTVVGGGVGPGNGTSPPNTRFHVRKPTRGKRMAPPRILDGSGSETDEAPLMDSDVDLDNIPSSLADSDVEMNPRLPFVAEPVDVAEPEPQRANTIDTARANTTDPMMPRVEPTSAYTNDTVVLGLKVYTHRDAPVVVSGQLRHEMKVSYAAFASAGL
ncbi:Calpain catalytic domain-containing protein [Mycena indigotica]|uniref:Calpain catalytic domain-containing protein n=1 Tax=Mycena indigotica TaxID=2126181 RepID=A0A8H6SPB9_9AGAR|nr:Calpain catalytic domain-containing protein [Mycena indigotica]KAF7301917.1 Calpain catalytic domain-containing protein [Mycena indigotica]